MNHEPRLRVVLSNDVRAAQTQTEKALATATALPRRRCLWGIRLYERVDDLDSGLILPLAPVAWHSYSTGGIVRYASRQAAETFGLAALRNTGDWRVERLSWWLAAWDSLLWAFVFSRKRK